MAAATLIRLVIKTSFKLGVEGARGMQKEELESEKEKMRLQFKPHRVYNFNPNLSAFPWSSNYRHKNLNVNRILAVITPN